jgi:hypothetical protein
MFQTRGIEGVIIKSQKNLKININYYKNYLNFLYRIIVEERYICEELNLMFLMVFPQNIHGLSAAT